MSIFYGYVDGDIAVNEYGDWVFDWLRRKWRWVNAWIAIRFYQNNLKWGNDA